MLIDEVLISMIITLMNLASDEALSTGPNILSGK
jgi:hypothetical protein